MKIVLTAVACAFAFLGATAQADEVKANPYRNICLNPQDIDYLSYPDDKTILFHMKGGPVRTYRNDLPYVCQGLHFESGIFWVIRGDEICGHMQTFSVLRTHTPCSLGDFTPLPPPVKKS
jgi:hypothetical protein